MSADRKPNILYILSDQHAASVLGIEGDIAADTPHFDDLARGGARFVRAYCASPICLPSRMSLLTGRRPHEQSCWTNEDILDSAQPTWLHALGAAGYRPVLVGRMHSMGPDQYRGYVTRPIGDHSPSWPGVPRRSLGSLSGTSGPNLVSVTRSGPGRSSYQALDGDVLQKAIALLEEHVRDRPDSPFALTVGFMLPHAPYVAAHEDFAAVEARVPPPRQPRPADDEHPFIRKWRLTKGLDTATPEEVQRARVSYYALVRHLDRRVGALLATLDRLGVAENTLVVYLSDHGDHIGERGLFWKHTLYEESIRVPLIMRWPGHIAAGQVVHTPVEVGGLGNTILSLIGSGPLPNATMNSFSGILGSTGAASAIQPKPVFVEYCVDSSSDWAEGCCIRQRAVIDGRHKLIYFDGYPTQLFDLEADPMETVNLAEDQAHAGMRERLEALVMRGWSPSDIRQRMRERAADRALIRAWAEATDPADPLRWRVEEEQNALAGEGYV